MVINQNRYDVLEAVRELSKPSITDISNETGLPRSTVKRNLDKLENNNWIIVKESQGAAGKDIREITDLGKDALLDYSGDYSDLRKRNTSPEHQSSDPYFVHFYSIICKWSDEDLLSGDWRERFKEIENLEVNEVRDFNRLEVVSEKWVFRFTGRSLEVQVRGEVSGDDFRTIKWRCWDKCMKGIKFLEGKLGESIPSERMEVRVKSQHVGSRGKDIAKTFIDHLDRNTEFDPREDFRVVDESDEIRIYADKSGPGDEFERESGNGGQVNGRMDTAEDDSQLLEDFTWRLISNPGDALRVIDTPGRVDEVGKRLDDVEDVAEGLSKLVEKQVELSEQNHELISEIRSSREEDKRVRDALIENVKSNEQVMKQNQDIIRRQEEMIEFMAEKLGQMEEEIAELRKGRSVEERVRRRFEDHPEFSTVHEHSSGNGDLYVWDYRGEENDYRKVLDAEARTV